MLQRMDTIYPGAPGATGWQAYARSLAEHATTKETSGRCRNPDDSTTEDKYSNRYRTNLAPGLAPRGRIFFSEI